jgi:predicted deacylase
MAMGFDLTEVSELPRFARRTGIEVGPDHLLGEMPRTRPGPMVLLSGGMHGNEPGGVLAIRRILTHLQAEGSEIHGTLIGLCGNIGALRLGQRYTDRDLNRRWDEASLAALRETEGHTAEDVEQLELLAEFDKRCSEAQGPVYLLDLHSFSATGVPFLVVPDNAASHQLAGQLGLPGIAGLEKAIPGTTLEYFSHRGHVAIGVEGGQHDGADTSDTLENVAWLFLASTGVIPWSAIPDLEARRERLARVGHGLPAVSVTYRHGISAADSFRMRPGFTNFQPVAAGDVLAEDAHGVVVAPLSGWILLPLYQPVGNDGFFIGVVAQAA